MATNQTECEAQGGTWYSDSNSCVLPPTVPDKSSGSGDVNLGPPGNVSDTAGGPAPDAPKYGKPWTYGLADIDSAALGMREREEQAFEGLAAAVPGVAEAFEGAAPALQRSLQEGIGEAAMASRGAVGRGMGMSGAELSNVAANQAKARTEAASRLADYGIDKAAQEVESASFLTDLYAAKARAQEDKYSSLMDNLWTEWNNKAGVNKDNTKMLAYMTDLANAYLQAGDQEAADFIMSKAPGMFIETDEGLVVSEKTDTGVKWGDTSQYISRPENWQT